MAGSTTEEPGAGRLFEGGPGGQMQQQTCQSGEALAEWRSSEQVENGTPSTSPPYWDSDDDDDGGPKPSELYGKYTWKIEKFSQINKRELRSNPFDVGGYKWYILIYPQGCDVSNHLSLFLCVANHDKLLPGWSHFAQFTICVVNKDPKKSKYSDTLHRFWKKEHDWGWKKFMELSKLLDGFIDADTLIIKAQVQVIRERADRPFRCLDCPYRRELVRVYLTNVEQICRRFVEERRVKLGKLIDDKAKWSSFCAFWLGMDQSSKRRMSQEKTDSILKIVVKHFFIEKEVTSTLVMDSLYSGLRALEGNQKGKKSKSSYLETEESAAPIVQIEKDMFVLVDDVLPLLERVAVEPLPPKDDKGPQNRTKDVVAGEEFNKDPIEHDERRLTELGRRTLEIFILAHVFTSKIEVAYQEAVALKRQEELIREEEEAWLAEIEQKARRAAADKEKKSRKKQGKQKRNNRKGKDKGRDDKASSGELGKSEQDSQTVDGKDSVTADPGIVLEKSEAVEDVSDGSDSVDRVPEILPPDSDDRDASPVNWDTDTSEVHPLTEASSSGISGLSSIQHGRSSSVVDDSSSTCSSDSVPFVSVNASHKGNSQHPKNQKSPKRSRNHQSKGTSGTAHWVNEEPTRPSEPMRDAGCPIDPPRSSKAVASPAQAVDCTLPQRMVNGAQRNVPEKLQVEENGSSRRNSGAVEVSRDRTARVISPPLSSAGNIPSIAPAKLETKVIAVNDPSMVKKSSLNSLKQADRQVQSSCSVEKAATLKPDTLKVATPKPTAKSSGHVGSEKPPGQQATSPTDKPSTPPTLVMSRPLSAPLFPGPKHPVSVAMSTAQTGPMLSRSVSAVGRLGPDPTASATQSYIPQSYRNAILGNPAIGSMPATQNHSVSSAVNVSAPYSQAPTLVSAPHRPDRMDSNTIRQGFSFGVMNPPDMLPNRPWMEFPERDGNRNLSGDRALRFNDLQSFDIYNSVRSRSRDLFGFPAATSSRQNNVFPDEFPHLDIINDLLEDEHGFGNLTMSNSGHQIFSNGHHYPNQQPPFSFLGDPSISNGPSLSTTSRSFDRTRSPLDDRGYAASGAAYDMIPQASPRSYVNRPPTDGLIPNQWQMPSPDLPYLSIRNTDSNNSYPYHIPEYQNLNTGANSYTVFRPSNGH